MMVSRTCALTMILTLAACKTSVSNDADGSGVYGDASQVEQRLADDERLLVILGTNDIHGGLDPTFANGSPEGGLAAWGGVVEAIRGGLKAHYGDRAGVALVDAGDQFQGTLLSNYNEGRTLLTVMAALGYDAVVPGNHDFDFGPVGWLSDEVAATPNSTDVDQVVARLRTDDGPLGALNQAVAAARTRAPFTMVSANTYLAASLVDAAGRRVEVEGSFCTPKKAGDVIDWRRARRVEYAATHVVKEIAGVRVAFIGLDHPATPTVTTSINVSDLCFRDPQDAYLEVFATLNALPENQRPQAYIAIIHDSDIDGKDDVSHLVEGIVAQSPEALHAVVAGHTHKVEKNVVRQVPILQSGHGARHFGRIELIWKGDAGRIDKARTRAHAGIAISLNHCRAAPEGVCQESMGRSSWDGVVTKPHPEVETLISAARSAVDAYITKSFGKGHLGTAGAEVKRNFGGTSPMGEFMTDQMRQAVAGANIALINSGSIRANIAAGPLTYETFFQVLPFGTQALLLENVSAATLAATFEKSVTSTKPYGVLLQSGLKVTVKRHGKGYELKRLALNDGTLIWNGDLPPDQRVVTKRSFNVVFTDFMMGRDTGAAPLNEQPATRELGVLRDLVATKLARDPVTISPTVDGRWEYVD